MTSKLVLAAAANTLAPALACLRDLGYVVTRIESNSGDVTYQAENDACSLLGDDVLQLLALPTLLEQRGTSWQPTDAEVAELLTLEGVL